MTVNATTAAPSGVTCDRTAAITRSLLGYGVIAGPLYVGVSLAQAVTRDGFDLSRHAWSLLSNGSAGWIQVTNFIVAGLMVLAAAVGLGRALVDGRGSTWVPRLTGGYGLSLVAAGVLRADPAYGFPAGTPAGPAAMTWHGAGHLMAGALGVACLIVACLIMAGRYAAERRRGLAWLSRLTGYGYLAAFAAIASVPAAATLAFTAAVVLAWVWLSVTTVTCDRAAAR
ncbi:MAG TPA: DUF998 domain-containing protein [Micromonosporaceae bacterium]